MTFKPSEPVDPTMPMELSDGRECRLLSGHSTSLYLHVGFSPGSPVNLKTGTGKTVRSAWFYRSNGERENMRPNQVTLRNRHDPLEFVYDV